MRWLCFILICWSTPLHAGWQEDLFSLLPQKLQELQLNKTTPKDAALLIGKPALIKGEKQYWVYDDFKYALELTFKEQKLSRIHFTFPNSGPSVDKLKMDPKNFKKSVENSSRFLDYHDVGGSVTIDLSSQSISTIRIPR